LAHGFRGLRAWQSRTAQFMLGRKQKEGEGEGERVEVKGRVRVSACAT
jgi:hypothetical protein